MALTREVLEEITKEFFHKKAHEIPIMNKPWTSEQVPVPITVESLSTPKGWLRMYDSAEDRELAIRSINILYGV